MIEKYNAYMGGVDKSDQLLSYHNVLRKTLRYRKTLFYHMIDIAAVNAFILYNLIATLSEIKTVTENQFRDSLVLQIIAKYGKNERQEATSTVGRPIRSDCRVKHGSKIFSSEPRALCQYFRTADTVTNWTNRRCPDCQFQPALCQTAKRHGHSCWHEAQFDDSREAWFSKQLRHSDNQSLTQPIQSNQHQACSLIIHPMTLFLSYQNVEGDLVDQRTIKEQE